MADGLAIDDVAPLLRVRPDTVRAWLRAGAPCVQPGGNGPGRQALVDPEALRAWRAMRARGAPADDPAPLVRVDAELVARGLLAAYREGLHRAAGATDRQGAAILADAWAHVVRAATGHPPREPWPDEIATLIAIARSSTSHP